MNKLITVIGFIASLGVGITGIYLLFEVDVRIPVGIILLYYGNKWNKYFIKINNKPSEGD